MTFQSPLKAITVCGAAALGGSETFFVTLTLGLQRGGVNLRAVLKHNGIREQALREARIPFDVLPFFRRFDWITGRHFRRIAKEFRPDIVLTITGRGAAMTPPGDYTLIGRLGGYYNFDYFRRCDYLVCNTPDLVRYVTEGGWAKDRVFYIPNFPHIDDAPAIDRAALGAPKDAPLAVALGRLHRNKAMDVLLRAAAQIPDLWVWIAGEGPDEAKLKKLARDLGIAERVKFLGWRTDRSALLKAADVCVFPSREEPFGNVVVEAWAYGSPLVAAASTGPAWLARDGEDAMLVPVDDPGALAQGVRDVLASKGLANRLVENGRKRIETEFSEHVVIGQYVDMFERVRPKRGA
ncbi:MAG TPA: glycosyltransferase [Rhizomicrobium sp.]|jgi:glycosyltransferase involved in cell wall biosynthesis|nr:glycosyltransferase [Rhizomicrobium sp.]